MKRLLSKNAGVWLFGICFGFMEAVVVVYLRKLFYANGFHFPLNNFMPKSVYTIEFFRELGTLLILFSVSFSIAKKFKDKFAYFFILFGIWDIFYYVFLKLLIDWPVSLKDWDILFLIPLNWFGPVWAPVLISVIFITLGYLIISHPFDIGKGFYISFFIGLVFVYVSFTFDFTKYLLINDILKNHTFEYVSGLSANYFPGKFPLLFYLIGVALLFVSPIFFYKKRKKSELDMKKMV